MKRNESGNLLILIGAFTFIIIAIIIFAISYLRLLGTKSEQKTAIEAAALAAARDISQIVIDTPEFGYIGISDAAPIGPNTTASDRFHTQVQSINTIIGTARVDSIIANQLNVPEWRILAKQDIDNARTAAAKLETALKDAIKPGGSGQDINGNSITPHASAEAAYKDNQIRLSGESSFQSGSLTLTLGALTGGARTNVDVPNPNGVDGSLDTSNTVGGKYKSYINIPYNGEDFVFAGIGETIKLVDPKNWVDSVSGIPYQLPTVVRAEATQQVAEGSGSGNSHDLRSVACAQPASVNDPRPAPGALLISFPDGMPDDKEVLTTPSDLYFANFLQEKDDDSNLYQSATGDFPITLGSAIADEPSWPLQSVDPDILASNCCKLAVYDWIRRAGTKINVNLVLGMHSTPFDSQGADVMWPPPPPAGVVAEPIPIPAGIAHIYRVEPDGAISYESKPVNPIPFAAVSDNQTLIECHDCIKKGAKKLKVKKIELGAPMNVKDGEAEFTGIYDLYVRIYGRKYGSTSGGQHRGQPLDDNFVSYDSRIELLKLNPKSGFGITEFKSRPYFGYGAKKKNARGTASTVGKGALPILGPREDFSFALTGLNNWSIDRNGSSYRKHLANSGAPTKRPSYETNGIAAEIRFRRVIKAKKNLFDAIGEYGYVMVK